MVKWIATVSTSRGHSYNGGKQVKPMWKHGYVEIHMQLIEVCHVVSKCWDNQTYMYVSLLEWVQNNNGWYNQHASSFS